MAFITAQFGVNNHTGGAENKMARFMIRQSFNFQSQGIGEYEEYNGLVECAECGKVMREVDADIEGNYAFCSYRCHMRFVGL